MRFLLKIIKILAVSFLGLIFLLIILFVLFNWPVKNDNQTKPLGISFSNVYARSLGLDWKKAYIDILDELKIKRIRLGAYWTEIEKKPGEYDFSDLDWQIKESEKRGVSVILALGIKVPRWPECFVPDFYYTNKEEREKALLQYERVVIERYKNSSSVKIWQIENEPFLPFGNCPGAFVDANILDKEILQTKQIDSSRPILITDSGEISTWYQAVQRGDIFGTTLYQSIFIKKIGYFDYPVGASFFRIKRWLMEKLVGEKRFLVIELQGEPWGSDWVGNLSWEEQKKTMDAEKLKQMVVLAQKTGFSEIYLWGAEWWYWLKETKNESSVWEMAKNLFNSSVVEKE